MNRQATRSMCNTYWWKYTTRQPEPIGTELSETKQIILYQQLSRLRMRFSSLFGLGLYNLVICQ